MEKFISDVTVAVAVGKLKKKNQANQAYIQ